MNLSEHIYWGKRNPWAMEEIGRRLLEASQRGLWQADPEVLEGLKETYLEVEGWLEENIGMSRATSRGELLTL